VIWRVPVAENCSSRAARGFALMRGRGRRRLGSCGSRPRRSVSYSRVISLLEQNRPALAELCRRYDVRRLDVFGSAVSDQFNPEQSDLDFLVEFNDYTPDNAADRYFGLLFDLEDLFGRKVDLVSDKSIRNPFFREAVDRTRVLLYAA
jgi:uncharacterized protein